MNCEEHQWQNETIIAKLDLGRSLRHAVVWPLLAWLRALLPGTHTHPFVLLRNAIVDLSEEVLKTENSTARSG